MTTRYFTPAMFEFLRELAVNNDKTWWEENKDRYTRFVRDPALDFISDFGGRLEMISPQFTADTRVNGGSLMRPHRDMRFAQGAPYKTNAGIHFRHVSGKDVHAPGFYLHLEPGRSYAGVGLWRPEASVAKRIRQAIFEEPDRWAQVAHHREFREIWSLARHEDDRLKRVPRELQGAHPHADDLRLRSFTAGARLTQKTVTSGEFADRLFDMYEKAGPYTRFLCDATGVKF